MCLPARENFENPIGRLGFHVLHLSTGGGLGISERGWGNWGVYGDRLVGEGGFREAIVGCRNG